MFLVHIQTHIAAQWHVTPTYSRSCFHDVVDPQSHTRMTPTAVLLLALLSYAASMGECVTLRLYVWHPSTHDLLPSTEPLPDVQHRIDFLGSLADVARYI